MNLLFHILFIFGNTIILIKTIFYGIYEINTQKNKYGGIAVICLSIFVVLLADIMIIIR